MMLPVLISILFQLDLPDVTFPDLPVPTPFVTAIPDVNDVDVSDIDTIDLESSSQTFSDIADIDENTGQVTFSGNELLPDNDDLPTVFKYFRWLTSSGSEAIFGSFAPIITHLAIILIIAIFALVAFIVQIVLTTIFKAIWWTIQAILKFVPFIG